MASSNGEKKFYNTWWFWVILAALIIFLVMSFNGGLDGRNKANPDIPEVTLEPITN